MAKQNTIETETTSLLVNREFSQDTLIENIAKFLAYQLNEELGKNVLTEDQLEYPQSIRPSRINTTNLLKQEQDYINYKIKFIHYFNVAKGICYGLSSMWLFGKGISKDINNETLTHDDTNKIWINDDKYIYNINELLKKPYLTLDDQQKLNIDVFIQNLLASHHTVEKR